MTEADLTVLSYGAGQDSTALLLLYAYDKEFRAKYVPGRFVVVCSDTGDEHPETYQHIEDTKDFCAQHGIQFEHLTYDRGYHGYSWRDLRAQYRDKKSCGSVSGVKACTSNLKVQPIYRWLEDFVEENYGFKAGRKKGLMQFMQEHGRINVLLGIAAKEESRMLKNFTGEADWRRDQRIAAGQKRAKAYYKANGVKAPKFRYKPTVMAKWMALSINRVYPLVEMGLDRQGCQDVIKAFGQTGPPPSNCMLCPFLSKQEILWLYRFYPDDFQEWVRFEEAKILEYRGRGVPEEKNHGVKGRKMLPEVLKEAMQEFGHMSDEDLNEYKMSHGHCVQSAY